MRGRLARVAPPALAALAGASIWMSLGQSAVLNERADRVAAMPPAWWLIPLIVLPVLAAVVTRLSLARAWPLALSLLLWLPYVPGPAPAAWLMWQGPLEGVVWVAIAAGVLWEIAPHRWSRVIRWPADARRAPYIAALLAALAYAVGAWCLGDLLPGGDEPHYLVTAQSLLLDGDLRIENNHARGDYLAYTDLPLKPDFIQRGKDGEIYPMHAPGTSVLVLPAFAIAGYAGAVASVIAMTATASALAWQAAWLLTASVSGAWVGWAAVFLTTPFFFHGFTIYPDGVGGLFAMAGVWLLVMLEMRRRVRLPHLLIAGAALSVLPWLHARFALIAAALGAAILLRLITAPRDAAPLFARMLAFLVVPVAVAASWFLYFWIIWGTPNPSAPQGRGDLMMTTGMIPTGAAGLLVDQQFGVASHAPAYAIALMGLALLARRHPRLVLELFVATVPYVIVTSSFAAWWGGVSAPGRYLAAILPMAVLPIAAWWRERTAPAWQVFTLLLVGLSVVMVSPKLAVNGGLLAYNDRAGFDLLLDWASAGTDLAMAFPSLHRQSLQDAAVVSLVWILAGAAMAACAWALAWRPAGRGATWTLMTTSAAVALMGGVTTAWAFHDRSGVRPAASQWAFLQSWSPTAEQFAFQLRPLHHLRPEALARRLEIGTLARAPEMAVSAPVLRAPALPAGEYELITGGTGTLQGEVLVQVGRTELLVERWRLDRRLPGGTGFVLRLPVPVHSVTIRADHAAHATAQEFRLRVRTLAPVPAHPFALRAIRYGRTHAFFMDDSSFMEPDGFWTRGEEATTVVLDTDNEAAGEERMLLVRSGAVPTRIDVTMGTWSRSVGFAANQLQAISLPAHEPGPRVVTIRTGPWFRPADHDLASRDTRRLGVFVSLP